MPTPLDASFWQLENAYLWDAMQEPTMEALLMGAANGVGILPNALQGLANWDFINQQALDFLSTYRFDLIGVNETTRAQTQKAIADWIRAGDPLPNLIRTLTPIFGNHRAESIAVTEVTRIFARGNIMAWESTQVISGKKWQTAVDSKVCPMCGPLHNQVVELDSTFNLTPQQMGESPQMKDMLGSNWTLEAGMQRASSMLGGFGGLRSLYPPAHTRCRCWLLPFVSEVEFEKEIGRTLASQFLAEANVEFMTVNGRRGFVVGEYA
jgi:rubredoxin